MVLIASKPVLLVIICAAAYAMSAVMMAEVARAPHPVLYVLVAIFLGAAAVSEIMVLRHFGLAVTYIAVIGAESVLVVSIATMIGQGMGLRELAGAGLVIAGTLIIAS